MIAPETDLLSTSASSSDRWCITSSLTSNEVAHYIYQHPIQGKRDIIYDWHYSSALIYYNRFHCNELLGPCIRYEDALPASKAAYYYMMESQLEKVPSNYLPLVHFENRTCLFALDTNLNPGTHWNEESVNAESVQFRFTPKEFKALASHE